MRIKVEINKKYLFCFIILFLIESLIAIFIHDNFIRPYLGDLLVIILIYCFISIFLKKKNKIIALIYFYFCCYRRRTAIYPYTRTAQIKSYSNIKNCPGQYL